MCRRYIFKRWSNCSGVPHLCTVRPPGIPTAYSLVNLPAQIWGTPEQLQAQVMHTFCCYLNNYKMELDTGAESSHGE